MNITQNTQSRRQGPDHRKNLWDRIWKNRQGMVVIYERPNALIISWAILAALSLFVSSGAAENIVWGLSSACLAVWALLELFKGTNYFRRGLGLVVLGLTIASIFSVGL